MSYLRKTIAIITTATLLALVPVSIPAAETTLIHQSSTQEKITSGATLERITRFTTTGWQAINVLRVDLKNPNIMIDSITNTESIMKLTPLKTLAEKRGAVAAINSSFFSWTSESGKGYVDGTIVESSKVISASSGYNGTRDSMASFALDDLKQIVYGYWKTKISLISPTGAKVAVAQFNKPSKTYKDITVLDSRWGKKSIGASEKYPDLFEAVVVDGKITEMRYAQPAVDIPQNGYVIVTNASNAKTITNNFKQEDNIELSFSTTPDWSPMQVAMTGGAILLKNGKIPSQFSVNIPGIAPRTALGSNKDGTQLIIAAIDGRQTHSVGVDQKGMATIMLELGAYNAINFDGGGSTTMVARHFGDTALSLINSPSDGAQRHIAAGLGVFSIGAPSELNELLITADDCVFKNTAKTFTVKGYDKNLNPVNVDQSSVTWSVYGVDGSFNGNVFYPKSSGEAIIKASIGNISSEKKFQVVGEPVELEFSEKSISLIENSTKDLTIIGRDKDGFIAKIDPIAIKWMINGEIGTMNENKFTAKSTGTGYIDASVGQAHSYCAVSVSSLVTTTAVIDEFEELNGSYTSYPEGLYGNYEMANEQKYAGEYCGKLTYDFSMTQGTRAAYMNFPNNGKPLDPNTKKLGLWAYSTQPSTNWLRAEVYDSKGAKHLIDFKKDMDWTGWKYIEASLEGVNSPKSLTKIYLAQTKPVPESGCVYFDNLTQTATTVKPADINNISIPEDTEYVDPASKITNYKKTPTSFNFGVYTQASAPKNLLEKLLSNRFINNANAHCDQVVLLGDTSSKVTESLKVPTSSTKSGYKSIDLRTSRMLILDTSKNGLRKSDPDQWLWFLNQVKTFAGDNLFIFMTNSPKNFSDKNEGNLFLKTLVDLKRDSGKNVMVFYKNVTNSTVIQDGVRLFSVTGYNHKGLDTSNASELAKHLIISVDGKNISYEFK